MSMTKTYEYETVDVHGKRGKGRVDASNEAGAAQALRQQGVVPVSIAESGTGLSTELSIPGLSGRTTLKDLAIFSRQFATMTSSGMSLLRSLAVLEDQTEKKPLKKAIAEIRADVESGHALSAAMGKHDRVFPRLMVAMVQAGE